MKFQVYAGEKAEFYGDNKNILYFECDNDDIDAGYDILAENTHLLDPERDLVAFQNLEDETVSTMLDDGVKHGFYRFWCDDED